jgi:hypothetical protein
VEKFCLVQSHENFSLWGTIASNSSKFDFHMRLVIFLKTKPTMVQAFCPINATKLSKKRFFKSNLNFWAFKLR